MGDDKVLGLIHDLDTTRNEIVDARTLAQVTSVFRPLQTDSRDDNIEALTTMWNNGALENVCRYEISRYARNHPKDEIQKKCNMEGMLSIMSVLLGKRKRVHEEENEASRGNSSTCDTCVAKRAFNFMGFVLRLLGSVQEPCGTPRAITCKSARWDCTRSFSGTIIEINFVAALVLQYLRCHTNDHVLLVIPRVHEPKLCNSMWGLDRISIMTPIKDFSEGLCFPKFDIVMIIGNPGITPTTDLVTKVLVPSIMRAKFWIVDTDLHDRSLRVEEVVAAEHSNTYHLAHVFASTEEIETTKL